MPQTRVFIVLSDIVFLFALNANLKPLISRIMMLCRFTPLSIPQFTTTIPRKTLGK